MFCLVLIVLAILSVACNGNVIGLDFGSDTLKVALVQPGKPLEIVSNFQSKRKTPTAITFYRGERMFGADATALQTRKPDLSFTKMHRMLGRDPSDTLVQEIREQYYPYEMYGNDTRHNSLCIKQDNTFYTPEELIAMMMQHAKDMTHNYGGKHIKDCVITVPSHYTQHQRRAMVAAAEIADLRVLSLIEENTAAALHYGIDRVFEEPHTIVYYNMGASTTQVSVVTYHSYKAKESGKNKTIGQFEVVGKGWDRSLGGFNFDIKLAELLADRFNDGWSKKKSYKEGDDVKKHILPMTKLRAQANKVKEVLSANPEFPVRAEQLHADVDLNTKVTRNEFEEACEPLFERITKPIDDALAMSGLTLEDIKAVELLGGGVRMPRVKKALDEYFGAAARQGDNKIEVGQHMNGDEAMALGAAFRAANLSTSFRVRKVGMFDQSKYGVNIQLETLPSDDDESTSTGFFGSLFGADKAEDNEEDASVAEETWMKKTGLFNSKATLPAKTKTVAITHDKNILCTMQYNDESVDQYELPENTSKLLGVYNVTGITEFVKEHEDKNLGIPKIHLAFTLDGSGVVQLTKAEATLELPKEPEPEVVEDETSSDDEESNSEKASTENTEDVTKSAAEAPAADTEGDSSTEKTDAAAAAANDDKTTADTDSSSESSNDEKTESETADDDNSKKSKKSTLDKGKKAKKDKKEKDKKKKDMFLRKILTINENYHLITPSLYSPEQIEESKAKLAGLDAADEARRQREAALNDLEGYIYSVKGRISDEEEELSKVSTDEQRQAVLDLGTETEDWLYEAEAKTADVSIFHGKQKELRKLAEPIFERYSEYTDRPNAITSAEKSLATVRAKLSNWTESRPWITEEDKEPLLKLVDDAEIWINDKVAEQNALELHEKPAFHSSDVPNQLKSVATAFDKLLKKKKPEPPKVDKNETVTINVNGTNSTSGTDDDLYDDNGDPIKKAPIKLDLNEDGTIKEPDTITTEESKAEAETETTTVDDSTTDDAPVSEEGEEGDEL